MARPRTLVKNSITADWTMEGAMYLITDEEEKAVLAMSQVYTRLKELGWKDIADFIPDEKDFGSAPFLGIELGSLRPMECEYNADEDAFTTLDDDERDDDEVRAVELIMFRHYKP
jgi:hypothetical protein